MVGGNDKDLPIVVFVSGDALKDNHAGNIVRELASKLKGSGGGRDNMANGKGSDKSSLASSLEEIKDFIK